MLMELTLRKSSACLNMARYTFCKTVICFLCDSHSSICNLRHFSKRSAFSAHVINDAYKKWEAAGMPMGNDPDKTYEKVSEARKAAVVATYKMLWLMRLCSLCRKNR